MHCCTKPYLPDRFHLEISRYPSIRMDLVPPRVVKLGSKMVAVETPLVCRHKPVNEANHRRHEAELKQFRRTFPLGRSTEGTMLVYALNVIYRLSMQASLAAIRLVGR